MIFPLHACIISLKQTVCNRSQYSTSVAMFDFPLKHRRRKRRGQWGQLPQQLPKRGGGHYPHTIMVKI